MERDRRERSERAVEREREEAEALNQRPAGAVRRSPPRAPALLLGLGLGGFLDGILLHRSSSGTTC